MVAGPSAGLGRDARLHRVSFGEADCFDADVRHPAEATAMGGGMLFAFGGASGILGHRETDDSLHLYLGMEVAEHRVDSTDFADIATAKATMLGFLDG